MHRATTTKRQLDANKSDERRHLISVVIPVFNEEECIAETIRRLEELRRFLSDGPDLEFIFVNDGSRDRSGQIIREYSERQKHVKLIELSRNFGHQIAVTAGIDFSQGDFVAIIDSDLQDPPEYIHEMYKTALQGYDVVYGKRKKRPGETWFKNLSAALFYRTLGYLSETDIPADTGDFRLISRRAADVLIQMRERHRFIRGMVPWIGLPSKAFEYDRAERHSGHTKYPLRKMIAFATDAILSFSSRPLIFVIQVGLLMILLGLMGGGYLLYLKLFTDSVVPGITSILLSIMIFSGIQISLIGVVGAYVAKLFDEVKGRPLYVVKNSFNV